MTGRLLAVLALAAAVLLGPAAASASAAPFVPNWDGSCAAAPIPTNPNNGAMNGWRDHKAIPPQADPFAPHATTTIFEQYGPAQFNVHVTGLDTSKSCLLQQPMGVFWTGLANMAMGPVEIAWDLFASVSHYAMAPDEWTGYLDPLVTAQVKNVRDAIWTPYSGLLVIAVGLWLVLSQAAYGMHRVVRTVAGLAFAAGLVALAVSQPLWFAQREDALLVQGVATATSAGHYFTNGGTATGAHLDVANPGEHMAGIALDPIMYDEWCTAQTGASSTSPLGKAYCPRLFKDQALTWAEAAVATADPEGKGNALLDAKEKDWAKAVEEIKTKYPSNFDFLRGEHSGDTLMAVFWMWFGTACTWPLMMVGTVLALAGYELVRFATIAIPAYGTIAMAPKAQHLTWTPLKWMLAVLGNVIGWFTAVLVDIALCTGLLSPDVALPSGIRMLLCAIVSVFLWFALRPLRSLTKSAFTHGYDPMSAAGGSGDRVGRGVKRWVGGYTAARAGTRAGTHDEESNHSTAHAPDQELPDLPSRDDYEAAVTDALATANAGWEYGEGRQAGWYTEEDPYAEQATGAASEERDDGPVHDGSIVVEHADVYAPEVRVDSIDGLPEAAGALPAGAGREGVVTFTDATGTTTPSPTDTPAADPRRVLRPIHPETGPDGEEFYVVYNPRTGAFEGRTSGTGAEQ